MRWSRIVSSPQKSGSVDEQRVGPQHPFCTAGPYPLEQGQSGPLGDNQESRFPTCRVPAPWPDVDGRASTRSSSSQALLLPARRIHPCRSISMASTIRRYRLPTGPVSLERERLLDYVGQRSHRLMPHPKTRSTVPDHPRFETDPLGQPENEGRNGRCYYLGM
jgi:hypothetical protein